AGARGAPPSSRPGEWELRSGRLVRRASSFGGGVADARVEERVGNVGEQGGNEEDDADDEDAACEQREVLVVGRGEDESAHPRIVEECLDHDETADQVAGL